MGLQAPKWNDRQKIKIQEGVSVAGNQILGLGNKVMGQDQSTKVLDLG